MFFPAARQISKEHVHAMHNSKNQTSLIKDSRSRIPDLPETKDLVTRIRIFKSPAPQIPKNKYTES